MTKFLNLTLLIALFANNLTWARTPVPQAVKKGLAVPKSYLESKKKLSPCEINFVKLLNGRIPVETMGYKKTSLWDEEFLEKNYLDAIQASPEFKTREGRIKFLDALSSFVARDQVYVDNVAKLANLMKDSGLVSAKDLRRVFVHKEFQNASFTYSTVRKMLVGNVNIDPKKAKLIDNLIKESELGPRMAKEYSQILRSSGLSADNLKLAIDSGLYLRNNKDAFNTLRLYLEYLEKYAGKKIHALKIRSAMKNINGIYAKYSPKWYNVESWFKPHKRFLKNSPETLSREEAIRNILADADVPNFLKTEYKRVLTKSRLTHEQLEFALKHGMTLRRDQESFERFTEYLVYLDYLPNYKVRHALKNVEKIYKYPSNKRFFIPNEALPPHKQFIVQRRKVKDMEERRYKSITRDFQLQEKDKLMKELDEILDLQRRGLPYDEEKLTQIKMEVKKVKLSPALAKRARAQAAGEASIFSKLLNGCNGGGSAQLESAKKKFKRFKWALSFTGTPIFYLTKNWDKKDEDQYFWEKLGQEMAMGFMFTYASNLIVTNTDKGFWAKYLDGYIKFGAIDVVSAGSYDMLFGTKGYGRYFQQIYQDGPVRPSVIEEELEELKNSPTFEQDVQEMLSFLEEKSKLANTKNLLDQYFNLSTFSSLDEDFKITQEDLETEEGREVMLELLAERMYLANMGELPLLQTGNTGADRWAFYRARNVLFDIKAMALNIAMFEIMCREPLGKIGSWGLVLGLLVTDWGITGDWTYGMRRQAINQ
ncbi:MAG: hypothetical protein CME64_03650 [Halobacteriovoraceae bacterium]|nr:hypothetical protein [Halobacteriovoraceae bacterium]|tara:strand:- start:6544 stop:8838 length:2295 start_codon:yes stop_codon:yes gene_type:complete